MGLFITITTILVAGIILAIIFFDKEFIALYTMLPIALILFTGLIIGKCFQPSFENEHFLAFDKTVSVSTLINSDGKEVYAFDYLGEVTGLNEIQFSEIVRSDGNKMTVHIVEKYTPRNFWHFKTMTRKIILIIPTKE